MPRETHDAQAISFLYSLRWAVELHFKLAKSGCELDEIKAERPVSAKILVHAAVLASLLANALAHLEHLDQGYVGEKVVRPTAKRPPVHAKSIWKMVRTSAGTITHLLAGEPIRISPGEAARGLFTLTCHAARMHPGSHAELCPPNLPFSHAFLGEVL